MKTILVVNPKGGCGKSTLATNLASYYALWNKPVALADYDPQRSSLEWLKERGGDFNPIIGLDASGADYHIPKGTQRLVMDAPARIAPPQLKKLFKAADCVIVPVLPSPIDIRAVGNFIGELMLHGLLKSARIGMVANRVRATTLIYANMAGFLEKLNIPLLTYLRDSQNYVRAADSGHGIFDMLPCHADRDVEHWRALIKWVEGK